MMLNRMLVLKHTKIYQDFQHNYEYDYDIYIVIRLRSHLQVVPLFSCNPSVNHGVYTLEVHGFTNHISALVEVPGEQLNMQTAFKH